MESKQLRAAGYRRVSMKEQVDGFSLDAQEHNIKQYVQMQGWAFVEMYTDAGISAKKDSQRPELERMLRDAEACQFDVVVVDKVDRFYRYLRGLVGALDQLKDWNVSFVSVQERLDFTTPWGKLTLTVLGTLAEIYIDNLRQETQKGKVQRARDGYWNGHIPYGYCRGLCSKCREANGEGYCPDFGKPDQGDGRTLILHPLESKVVRLVYDWYLTGEESCRSVAKKLWDYPITADGALARTRGVPGWMPSGSSRRGMVYKILRNPFYAGLVPYYGKYKKGAYTGEPKEVFPGRHPAIIDCEQYDQVMKTRAALRRSPRSKRATAARLYLLSGLLYCGYCGKAMRGSSTQRGGHHYRDATRIEKSGECLQNMIHSEQVETQVVDWVMNILRDATVEEKHARAEAVFQKAQTRFERAKELYLAKEMGYDDYLQEKEKYEMAKLPLQENGSSAIIPLIKNARSKFLAWQSLTPIEKKKLLQLVIEAVFLQGSVLVGVQPTVALLPFTQVDNRTGMCNIIPNEGGKRNSQPWVLYNRNFRSVYRYSRS